MQKGIVETLVLLCFLGFAALQSQTFTPILPGTLHVDEFSTLDNQYVSVPSLSVVDFGAAVLDFQSLTTTTPINVDIAGGVNFQGTNVQFSSVGAVGLTSQVNNLPINAIQGQILLQSTVGSISTTSKFGDLSVDSANSNINLQATNGVVSLESATFLLNGREDTYGLSLTSTNGGNINIGAGQAADVITSQININAYEVTFELASSTSFTSTAGDVYVSAGDGIALSSVAIAVNSKGGITTTSDVANIQLEAQGPFSLSANTVDALTSNNQAYASVTGTVAISATGTSDYQSLQSIQLNGVNNGVYINARNNVTSTAGNNVILNGDGAFEISSTDLLLESQRANVIIETNGDTNINAASSIQVTTAGDSTISAQNEVSISARGVSITTQVDALINSDNQLSFNTSTDADFFANNIYIDTLNDYAWYGNALNIISQDDIQVQSGLNIEILSGDDVKYSANGLGIITGKSSVYLGSALDATINAGNIFVQAGGDVTVDANNINYSINGSFTGSSTNGEYSASLLSFEAGQSIIYLGGTMNFVAESGILLTAFNQVYSTGYGSFDLGTDSLTLISPLIILNAGSDIFSTTDQKVIFQNTLSPSSLTSVDANQNIVINSGEADLAGGVFNLNSFTDAHFFARVAFTFNSAALTITATSTALSADGELDFYATALSLLSTNTYFTADDAYGGAISFTSSAGSTTLSAANNFLGSSDAVQILASSSITFTTGTFFLFGTEGDITFNAGGKFTHSTLNGGTSFSSNSFLVSADGAVSLAAGGVLGFTITSRLNQNVQFNSGGNLSVATNDDILYNSNFVSFAAVESGLIASNTFTITAGTAAIFQSADFININSSLSDSNYAQISASLAGQQFIDIVGGSLDYALGNAVINANGGGARFYSTDNTYFNVSSNFNALNVLAYHLSSYTAYNGSISITAQNENLNIIGGASQFTSGVNSTLSITSAALIQFQTNNNGNFTFYSDYDFIETAFTEIQFYGTLGRDGNILTTYNDSNICIQSLFDAANTYFEAGKSMEVQAYGEDGFIQAFANLAISVNSNAYGISILSEGYQSDPQYELTQPYGVLLRTTDPSGSAGIAINSDTESISLFGREGFYAIALNQINQNANNRLDVRSVFDYANILVQTTNGDINFNTGNGFVLSGTPSIRADTQINATGHISYTAASASITQLSTIQDPSNSAIIFEAYFGDLTIDTQSTATHSFTANDGGNIYAQSRNGNINFHSANFTIDAITGAVSFQGRTSATLTNGGSFSVAAEGEGGTLLLSTSGGNDIVIHSLDLVDISSSIGEVALTTVTGITTNSLFDTTLTGPCIKLIGGGSLNIEAQQQIVLSTTDNDIEVNGQLQVTVDTALFTVAGLNVDPLIRITAGGDTSTPGFDITSQGDIVYTTQYNFALTVLSASFVTYTDVELTTVSLNITSFGDSTSQTNVVIQATNGNIVTTTPFFSTLSLTETDISSAGPIVFNVFNTITITSAAEVRYTAVTMDVKAHNFEGEATNQFFTANAGDIDATVGTNFYSYSDSFTYLTTGVLTVNDAAGQLDFTTYTGPIDFQAGTDLALTSPTFTSTSLQQTEIDGYSSVSFSASTSTALTAVNSIIFTAISNIAYTDINNLNFNANNFQSTSGSTLTVSVTNTVTFSAYDFQVAAGGDFAITATNNIDIEAKKYQSIAFTSTTGTIDLTSPLQSYTANDNIYLTALTGLDNVGNGITINIDTLNFNTPSITGVVAFDSQGNTVIQNYNKNAMTFVSTGVTYFISSGQAGVYLDGQTLSQTSTQNIFINAEAGNLYNFGYGKGVNGFLFKQNNAYVTSYSNEGDILLSAGTGDSGFDTKGVSFTASQLISIQPLNDPGTLRGYGNITFFADETFLTSQTVNINSLNQILVTSAGIGGNININANAQLIPVSFSANRKVDVEGHQSQYSSPLITFNTAGPLSDFVVESSYIDQNYGTITDSTTGEFSFVSGANVLITALTVNFHSDSTMLFLADSSFIDLDSATVNVQANEFSVTADVGNIKQTYTTYTLSNAGAYTALVDGEAFIDQVQTLQGTTVTMNSARDIVIGADSVALTAANNINLQTFGEGDITSNSAGAFTLSGAQISFVAQGNLGALGGRYVINDQFKWDTNVYRYYNQRLININKDAIELLAVSEAVSLTTTTGDVFIQSKKGNVDFRSLRNVLYYANYGSTGRITFFNVISCLGGCGDVDSGNIGYNRPFNLVNLGGDICSSGGGGANCVGLTSMLDRMVGTMIAYGLLEPGNGWGINPATFDGGVKNPPFLLNGP